jgi:hypothetical protein
LQNKVEIRCNGGSARGCDFDDLSTTVAAGRPARAAPIAAGYWAITVTASPSQVMATLSPQSLASRPV